MNENVMNAIDIDQGGLNEAKAFAAADFPLSGHRLIEASAGTGKTYNIANLYLRLLLGDGCVPKSVDQILVVTFTRAATNELRGRIREKVEQALRAYRDQASDDQFIQTLLQKMSGSRAECQRLLNNALLRMDEACIFTIHGFAVRAVQTFLFETGALADVDISETGNSRKDLLLADLWRQLHLTTDDTLRQYVATLGFKTLGNFASFFAKASDKTDISPSFLIPLTVVDSSDSSIASLVASVAQYVASRINPLLEERALLLQRWQVLQEAEGESGLKKSLGDTGSSKLFEKIQGMLESRQGKLVFPSGKMMERMQALHDSDSREALPEFIRSLSRHIINSVADEDLMRSGFRSLLLQYINVRMAEPDLSAMQLDEVINLISGILRRGDDKAHQLCKVVTEAYPVCMVDEFQDTDPAQFEMFNLLYANNPAAGFFMIGDPKQSIYQFRGADIFSYLAVRKAVKHLEATRGDQHVFTLDTNYRSKSALVAATNRLFTDKHHALPSFLYPGIDYVSVQSCEDLAGTNNKGELTTRSRKLATAPLVFVGNDADVGGEEKFNGDTLRWKYAKDTAQRIALLIHADEGGLIHKPGKAGLPVAGGDIAVLVRTGREAACVREALLSQVPPIGSVYQSQNDSVFKSSCIAEDIYHLLCAMDEPGDRHLLKKAMVTLLYRGFALDFSALDAMNADDTADDFFEQSIAEFSGYRRYWDDFGVLAALNHLVQQRGLLQKLALLPQCDRLVTDLRHLGELLQAKSQEFGSREQLILWFGRQMTDDSELDEGSKRIRLESDENLVKIVTIHVSKGLEYPIVFLPFFFMPWLADVNSNLPLYHPEPDYQSRVDFAADASTIKNIMQKEMLAEDMRLLYVAITRAVYQCYIGISASKNKYDPRFPLTCWAHLLDMQAVAMPGWPDIRTALQQRFGNSNSAIDYRVLFDASPDKQSAASRLACRQPENALQETVAVPALPVSNWVITSYSALAHARKEPGQQRGGYDEMLLPFADRLAVPALDPAEQCWESDIRYRLPGGARTGDCLHKFFEELVKSPARLTEEYAGDGSLLHDCLRRYALDKPVVLNSRYGNGLAENGLVENGLSENQLPDERQLQAQWRKEIAGWMHAVLDAPLMTAIPPSSAGPAALPSLRQLFTQQVALPEFGFDMALGKLKPASIAEGINRVLHQCGLEGVTVPRRSELAGILTGSIDLLFIHDKKVYVLDYKSNTLGKAPHYYDRPAMSKAMKENRYDLQCLIYSVAAHRYMQQRLGDRYDFECGEYSFGGAFYLFLRGMGLAEYPGQGVFFERPARENVLALDGAFSGLEILHD